MIRITYEHVCDRCGLCIATEHFDHYENMEMQLPYVCLRYGMQLCQPCLDVVVPIISKAMRIDA